MTARLPTDKGTALQSPPRARETHGVSAPSRQPKDAAPPLDGRIDSLDGLRGLAALVVAVFHFFCLLMPALVPKYAHAPALIAYTPLKVLWNGPFAVSVLFVLSGFFMAASAERRHALLVSNIVTRYLRLALPVSASIVLAWTLLSVFPTATADLHETVDNPSAWLGNTHQGAIPSLATALFDGLVGVFARGGSEFNNVLWAMRIELIGSIGILGVYWVSAGRTRIALLTLAAFAVPAVTSSYYLAFVLGALIFEAHVRNRIQALRPSIFWVALLAGFTLGASVRGTTRDLSLPELHGKLLIGNPGGIFAPLAAALILLAVLALPRVAGFFSTPLLRRVGRISFGLYLVHVPLLYTVVAVAHVHLDWPVAMLAAAYLPIALALGYLLTVLVDEPTRRLLKPLRNRLSRCDRFLSIPRVS